MSARDKQERHANDGRVQETGEWWGRARHRRMMGKSERQASDGEEQERHATDGGRSNDGEEEQEARK